MNLLTDRLLWRRILSLLLLGMACIFFSSQTPSAPTQGAAPPTAGPDKRHKFRTHDRAVAKRIVEQGGELIADYGGYQLFRVDAATARELANEAKVENASEQNFIGLNAGPLDTASAVVQGLRQPANAAVVGKRLHLLQFAGPVKPEWFAELEQTGVEVVQYVPHNAYLVYAHGRALAQMQSWARAAEYVQWEGPFRDEYKIHPRAYAAAAKKAVAASDLFAVQLVADPEANAASLSLIDGVKLGPIKRRARVLKYLNVVVALPPERLNQIAAQPEVVSIHRYVERRKFDERQNIILIGNLNGTVPAAPGYLAWLSSKGFTQAQFAASGLVIDVTDSGMDNATTTPGHFGLYQFGQTNQPSRVVYNRLEGIPNPASTIQGCDGHGTLNTHIIAGYNDRPAGFPHTDSAGFHYGLGVCPFVRVGSSVIFDPDKFTFPEYADLISRAYNDGARVSNNSWGADVEGDYEMDSQEYDALVRDGQPAGAAFPNAGNQEMIILFASGNAGPGVQTVGTPGTAKNVITVGAAENVQSHAPGNGGNDIFGTDGCGSNDLDADNANDIVDFSSRGPCSDGRKKPDIVAPGTHVAGGVAQISPAPPATGNGSALACFRASGVCALPGGGVPGSGNNFFPMGQQFYTTSSGTSHSTPATAGACALLRQHFINLGSNPPSPAMTKALLMNSARYLNGIDANDSLWSQNQGMGEVNLSFMLDSATTRVLRDQAPANKFTSTGQTRTFTGQIVDPAKPFRVTVAWTDAPGNTIGNAFNNNLDLTVTVGGNTYKGNVFSGAFSATGGVADSRNNAESVFLPAGLSGNFEVTINAANINSDGVPNEGPALDQDFALVIYNGIDLISPVIVADSVSVTSESCNPANSSVDPGETVTVNFALKNSGNTNTVNLVASLQATGGISSVSSSQNYGVLSAGGPAVSRSFSFTANGACGAVLGAVLQLQDTTNLGSIVFSIPLGSSTAISSQNFDGASAPSLPAGWTTFAGGGQSPWVTSDSQADTFPNSAYSANGSMVGTNELLSPVIPVNASAPQLSFRHSYDMEQGYDGGLLEMKIGTGAFMDVIVAGGSFVAGSYTHVLNSSYGNPLGGRQAWSGNSGGYITTTINLPASAAGQNIQLRWRCATDQSLAGNGWSIDTIALNGRLCCGGIVVPPPLIQSVTASLQSEGCAPSNAAPDPGETVTYNFAVQNVGVGNANNLLVTLLETNGIVAPSSPQDYGTLNGGSSSVSRPFSFTIGGSCGSLIRPTFRWQDNNMNTGLVSFSLQLGQFTSAFAEAFDGVTAPNLPAGWTTTGGGAQPAWVTSVSVKDTSPNSAFSASATTSGTNQLISPAFILPATPVQLDFRNYFDLESGDSGSTAYDGGVLEIKIGDGSFTDIFTAGGVFISGGYSHVLSTLYGNPLAGRRCWSGSSGGFITSSVLLPPGASGQTAQLRWRTASDSSVGSFGWFIDTVTLTARTCCGEIIAPVASFTGSPANGGRPLTVVFTDTSTGTITNHSWNFGNGISSNTMLSSVSATYTNLGTYTVALTVSGPLGTNKLTRTNYVVVTNAIAQMVSNSFALLTETCTNGVIDPGETVTMTFGLRNVGTASTTNLVATLQTSGGITLPGGPQSYGALVGGGAPVLRSFTFVPIGSCGTTNVASLQLQDGPTNYGTIGFAFVLGQAGNVLSTQNFDSVSAPALPAGWTTASSGAATPWVTSGALADTSPNSAFAASVPDVGLAELVSPSVLLSGGAGQLIFRHWFDMESFGAQAFDGGVLDIKIGAGNFTNITAAGGIFISNGYNAVVAANFQNPLAGQACWSGSSGTFLTTTVNLPAGAAGQNVQFRWRCGSDNNFSSTGWYVDSVAISGYQCCASPPVTRPILLAVKHTNNSLSFVLSGEAGYNYAIEGSTNLANWSNIATVSNASGQVQFTDPTASNHVRRVYRARLVP